MKRTAFHSPDVTPAGPYSHAVDSEGLVFLSGQTAVDPSTGALLQGGIVEQTRQCFSNLFAVLRAAGLTPDHVQKVTVYLTDMADFTAMNEAYKDCFAEPYPARTTLGVASLPRGAAVEIELIARRDRT